MSSSQVSRILDEEHRSNIALLGKLEQALARASRFDPALSGLIGQFVRALEHDVDRHFQFEEDELFPRMTDAGDGGDGRAADRGARRDPRSRRRVAAAGAHGRRRRHRRSGWSALRRNALELVERQVAHIQKETMALLPLLDDLLDEADDRELAFAYAET